MQCIHEKDGCPWHGEISELNIHLETCLYDLIDCPNKCGKKVANVSVDEHLNVFCISMARSCRHCGITTTGQDQVEHRNVCLKYPVPCPNDCDVGYVIRGEMDKHCANECTRSIATCPLKHVGYRFEGSKSTLTKHMTIFSNEHLLLVSGFVVEQATQITNLTAEKEKQKLINIDLIKKMSQLETEKKQAVSDKEKVETDFKSKILEHQNDINCIRQELEKVKEIKTVEVEKRQEEETIVGIQEPVQLKQLKRLNQDVQTIKKANRTFQNRLQNLECKQLMHDMILNHTITDGCYTCIIDDFENRMNWAKNGVEGCLESPEFYLHLNGYKLQGTIHLNGDCPDSKKQLFS